MNYTNIFYKFLITYSTYFFFGRKKKTNIYLKCEIYGCDSTEEHVCIYVCKLMSVHLNYACSKKTFKHTGIHISSVRTNILFKFLSQQNISYHITPNVTKLIMNNKHTHAQRCTERVCTRSKLIYTLAAVVVVVVSSGTLGIEMHNVPEEFH